MRSKQIAVQRTARYFTCGADPAAATEVWYALHGYGQLARDFLEPFDTRGDERRHFVAPEGLSRFYLRGGHGRVGASWMTREARAAEIADQLELLLRVHAEVSSSFVTPPALHVLGFSQGAATAARFTGALEGAGVRVARLILWAGDAPPELDPTRLAQRVTLVRGRADAALTAERLEAERERFEAAGLEVDRIEFDGGHALDPGALDRLFGMGS